MLWLYDSNDVIIFSFCKGHDKTIDAVIDKHSQAQTVFVRSLFGDWKMPVYVGFDKQVTVDLLNEIIIRVEDIGIRVHATVCDMAGKNRGKLWVKALLTLEFCCRK